MHGEKRSNKKVDGGKRSNREMNELTWSIAVGTWHDKDEQSGELWNKE